jgi:hypothetical protein
MLATRCAFFQTTNDMTWNHCDGPKLKPAAYPPLCMDTSLNVELGQELG